MPLFKKGEKSNPENYRPIALTCALCRVMEMVLNKYIVQFLLDMLPSQFYKNFCIILQNWEFNKYKLINYV